MPCFSQEWEWSPREFKDWFESLTTTESDPKPFSDANGRIHGLVSRLTSTLQKGCKYLCSF